MLIYKIQEITLRVYANILRIVKNLNNRWYVQYIVNKTLQPTIFSQSIKNIDFIFVIVKQYKKDIYL